MSDAAKDQSFSGAIANAATNITDEAKALFSGAKEAVTGTSDAKPTEAKAEEAKETFKSAAETAPVWPYTFC
jgi:hypothetical protein